jgi:sugar lactone lactonase YvrE
MKKKKFNLSCFKPHNLIFNLHSTLILTQSQLVILSIRAPIDEGTEQIVVLQDKTVTSDGLAVDWIYNHIYFTDTKRYTIEIMNFDGNMGKVLIKDNLEIPRAIALNPLEGWMFWSDWGSNPRIERAGMDGTHRQTIVSYDVKWPNGLTLDIVQKRIYWVN